MEIKGIWQRLKASVELRQDEALLCILVFLISDFSSGCTAVGTFSKFQNFQQHNGFVCASNSNIIHTSSVILRNRKPVLALKHHKW